MQLYTRKLNFNNTKLIQSLDSYLDSYTYEWLYQVSKGAIDKFLPKEIIAINYLVRSLKEEGLWDKFIAIYPFIGRTAELHSYNLISSSSWQITWYGTVSHNAYGVAGDGSTGYGNIAPIIDLFPAHNSGSQHASVYIYSNPTSFQSGRNTDANDGTVFIFLVADSTWVTTTTLMRGSIFRNDWNNPRRTGFTSVVGFFAASNLPSAPSQILRANGTNRSFAIANGATAPTTQQFDILRNSRGNATDYGDARINFYSLGSYLTEDQLIQLETIVQNYQTILGRAI